MQQDLWHDSFDDALRSVVEGVGPKKIAAEVFPGEPIQRAAQRLFHCLDPERGEKLSLSQVAMILQRGRAADCHVGMAWLCENSGYGPPQPLEPKDQQAELQRAFVEAQQQMEALVKRMERLK